MEKKKAVNVYVCPSCGWRAITVNLVDGVTPFFIRCEGARRCDADRFPSATSAMYRVDQSLTPTHEWYRPDEQELNAKPYMREHVEQGGLALRKIYRPVEQRLSSSGS